MEGSKLPTSPDSRERKKAKVSEVPKLSMDEKAARALSIFSAHSTTPLKLEPITPAKATKRNRSAASASVPQENSIGRTRDPPASAVASFKNLSDITEPKQRASMKIPIVELWYKNLYSQTRPKSITFVALDTKGSLFEIIISDTMSEKWAPRLEEGKVYLLKHLLSNENEKKPNVVETRFQMNFTKDTKCVKVNTKQLKDHPMLPITKLSDLPEVRAREKFLRHFVVYVIDVRPLSIRTQKKGEPSRFVEAYVVDDSHNNVATVLTVWDNIYDEYTDLFGHGFTKPFVLTAFGLKVKEFRGQPRRNLLATNLSTFATRFRRPRLPCFLGSMAMKQEEFVGFLQYGKAC